MMAVLHALLTFVQLVRFAFLVAYARRNRRDLKRTPIYDPTLAELHRRTLRNVRKEFVWQTAYFLVFLALFLREVLF